ncbi:hypothetical protein ABIE67_007853 [Streptomyces sp. V4I8]|uniref:hypothetical protein n=1 Tax=Streptomyces sp. V4I8 TaxID=3156469 RepID=UPI003513B8DD
MTNLITAAALIVGGFGVAWWQLQRGIRSDRRRTPAAPDNQPGTNTDDLWTCRHILREPLADPDHTRRLINYLRDTGEENPQP